MTTKTTRDLFYDMYKKQCALDNLMIEKKNGGVWPERWQIQCALQDEVGEFLHELKPAWCYWKADKPDIDMDKAKEELIDVLHFILCLLHFDQRNDPEELQEFTVLNTYKGAVFRSGRKECYEHGDCRVAKEILSLTSHGPREQLSRFLTVARVLFNWDISGTYELYCKKNRINIDRANSNY